MKKWISRLVVVVMVALLLGCGGKTHDDSPKQTIFSISKTGNIVTDKTTKLQWQNNETSSMHWERAKKYCKNLTLGGYNDWRLPNIKELTSLAKLNKVDVAKSVFRHTGSFYWSSTRGDWTHAHLPYYVDLDRYSDNKNHAAGTFRAFNVRCVRGGE